MSKLIFLAKLIIALKSCLVRTWKSGIITVRCSRMAVPCGWSKHHDMLRIDLSHREQIWWDTWPGELPQENPWPQHSQRAADSTTQHRSSTPCLYSYLDSDIHGIGPKDSWPCSDQCSPMPHNYSARIRIKPIRGLKRHLYAWPVEWYLHFRRGANLCAKIKSVE